MEVKIGVQQGPREVVLESAQTQADVLALATAAVENGTPLVLTDDKGRTVLVPGEKIAYIEVGHTERGRVGFQTTTA